MKKNNTADLLREKKWWKKPPFSLDRNPLQQFGTLNSGYTRVEKCFRSCDVCATKHLHPGRPNSSNQLLTHHLFWIGGNTDIWLKEKNLALTLILTTERFWGMYEIVLADRQTEKCELHLMCCILSNLYIILLCYIFIISSIWVEIITISFWKMTFERKALIFLL